MMKFFQIFVFLAMASSCAFASDPSPLQDFCVAVDNPNSAVFVNGMFCKDPKLATADDFSFTKFRYPRNTTNPLGSKVTTAFVDQFPGLNTLGIAMARLDFAPYGLNPPHIHPRGTEMLAVVEGTLLVGFVTSNQLNNTLFSKVLTKGDVFVFPQGLIHFQLNIGQTNALAFAFLSSQNPGLITIANSVFGSKPPINVDVLTKAFQVDSKLINYLQAQNWFDNH
ncbi:germin-like protein subfamily 1 member 17 [Syzygium oleosum]|uniref:germin-like protein subfamily 1 member 17 n=1 Tax=Syzygium oleosum TaxID=219896 RepID=UPI0011D1EE54|nr:germin-like protein subfamily 1 member 17 [Syzygium oleosum]